MAMFFPLTDRISNCERIFAARNKKTNSKLAKTMAGAPFP